MHANHVVDFNQNDIDRIKLHLLHTFFAVGETGSIPAAAAHLGMPHAVVSQHLNELETVVGVPLIRMGIGDLRLSEFGQSLMSTLANLTKTFQSQAHKDIVTLLAPKPVDPNVGQTPVVLNVGLDVVGIASVLKLHTDKLFAASFPLNFTQTETATQPPDVRCYFAERPDPELESVCLFGEKVVAVAAAEYEIPNDGFSEQDMLKEPLVRFDPDCAYLDWANWFSDSYDTQTQRIMSEPFLSYTSYLRALKAGRGIGLVLADLVSPFVDTGQLRYASKRRIYGRQSCFVGFDPNGARTDQAKDFILTLRSIFPNEKVS